MGKTVSKVKRFEKRRDRDNEDMKGFLRSKQKGPGPGSDIREAREAERARNARNWQDFYALSCSDDEEDDDLPAFVDEFEDRRNDPRSR